MTFLADIFPLVATLGIAGLILYALLSKKSLAAGSESAGPVVRQSQDVHGLSTESQDVVSIANQISTNPGAVIEMMTELCQIEGITADVKPRSNHLSIGSLLTQLEEHLEIQPGRRTGKDAPS